MQREMYFDNNATTRPLREVRDAMCEVFDEGFGNPSSAHGAGERAREAIHSARASIAAIVGALPEAIVFTSGATEANNMVIASTVARRGDVPVRIVTSAVEHPSIAEVLARRAATGIEVVVLPVSGGGLIDLASLDRALAAPTDLVTIQWANSETGVLQPIRDIGQVCRRHGVPLHTDAAQAVGKLQIDLASLPVEYLSMSAHKVHGPAGVGALYIRDVKSFTPILFGGPQELGLRPGTENVGGIVGFGVATSLRRERFADVEQRLRAFRDRFESLVRASTPNVSVNGGSSDRLYNTTNLQFDGVDGQALVGLLDQHGVRCSQSTACTARRPEPSRVLRAMGLTEHEAYASIRFSVGEWNTMEDVEDAAQIVADLCSRLRAFRARHRHTFATPTEVH